MPPPAERDSEFIEHVPCTTCGSSDAAALYTDGHTHCFACGVTVFSGGDTPATKRRRDMAGGEFLDGDIRALASRSITEDTCRKFGYRVGTNRAGKTVQIAEYRDAEGTLIAQKVRDANKDFSVIGEGKHLPLFGQWLWDGKGRRVTVTEGEIDALSVSQAFGNKWPAVSVPQGAQGAKKAVARSLEWLEGFEEVVFCFDMDEPGREAAVECAALLTPGKAKIAELPLKDANELLKAGKDDALRSAIYSARTYRPDGIVSLDEIEDRVLAEVEIGFPWPFDGLTAATFGRRPGEIIGVGAGTGIGKSDFLTQCIANDVMKLGLTVGGIFLEQGVADTGRRVAGKIAEKRFHVPGAGWTKEELRATWGRLKATGRLHLYDSFGAMDWQTIKAKMRYMAAALGCNVLYLDHLTCLAAAAADEKTELELIMSELSSLAQALSIIVVFVSHLTTPENGSHEEGARVTIRQFKGSRAIGFWSHGLIGLERNQQAGTEALRSQTTLRVLKDRFTGNATGKTFCLGYNRESGMLFEKQWEEESAASGYGFADEAGAEPF